MERDRIETDPFNDPQNEYNKARSQFIFDYELRTASIKTDEDLLLFEVDESFKNWERKEKQKINEAFKKVCNKLNRDEVYYFGCPFSVYKETYPKRLEAFLNNFHDVKEIDFINAELEYLENTLTDLENHEAATDGYSLTGIDNFTFANRIVEQMGFEQFLYSTKKKIEFLENKQRPNTGEPQQSEVSDIENKFDHVLIEKVYAYFKTELVSTNYLTDTELREYLKAAFEDKQPPKERFTFKNDPTKSTIRNVFYRYYKDIGARGRRKYYRQDCAELLGEYFNGYETQSVLSNFNK